MAKAAGIVAFQTGTGVASLVSTMSVAGGMGSGASSVGASAQATIWIIAIAVDIMRILV